MLISDFPFIRIIRSKKYLIRYFNETPAKLITFPIWPQLCSSRLFLLDGDDRRPWWIDRHHGCLSIHHISEHVISRAPWGNFIKFGLKDELSRFWQLKVKVTFFAFWKTCFEDLFNFGMNVHLDSQINRLDLGCQRFFLGHLRTISQSLFLQILTNCPLDSKIRLDFRGQR